MPSSAYAGDLVTLIGQCFSTVVSENQVTINGAVAEVKEATSSQLKIIIPDTEEGSYPIRVKVGTKEAESPLFTYLHTVTLTTSSLALHVEKRRGNSDFRRGIRYDNRREYRIYKWKAGNCKSGNCNNTFYYYPGESFRYASRQSHRSR